MYTKQQALEDQQVRITNEQIFARNQEIAARNAALPADQEKEPFEEYEEFWDPAKNENWFLFQANKQIIADHEASIAETKRMNELYKGSEEEEEEEMESLNSYLPELVFDEQGHVTKQVPQYRL